MLCDDASRLSPWPTNPRFEKRHKNMTVHCAPCWQNVKEGDIVTIGQCRPLSKTVRFNVLEHEACINTVKRAELV